MADKIEKKKTALSNSKLSLSAPCPTAKGKFSVLKWELFQNNPRIIVRSNDPAEMNRERNFGQIIAPMGAPEFYAFLEMLKLSYESPGETKSRIENWNQDYVDGKRTTEPIHISDTWIGKDREGCVFISVISKKEDRPVIKFITAPADDRWHKFFHADGTQYTKAETSVIYAKAYYNMLTKVMANLICTEYVEPPPYVPGGGAGANYQQKPNNANNSTIKDEDLPF